MVLPNQPPLILVKWGVYEAKLPGGAHPVVIVDGPDVAGNYRVLRGRTRENPNGAHVAVIGGLAGTRMGLPGPTHFWEEKHCLLWIPAGDFVPPRRGVTPADYKAELEDLGG